jgi:hypothetical protein
MCSGENIKELPFSAHQTFTTFRVIILITAFIDIKIEKFHSLSLPLTPAITTSLATTFFLCS